MDEVQATQATDSAAGTQETQSQEQTPQIDPKAYQKLIEEANRYKSESLTYKKELSSLSEKIKELQSDKAKLGNDWKSAYEMEKKAREEAETKQKGMMSAFERNEKYNALRAEALKLGIRPDAEDDLSRFVDDVAVEWTTEGRAIPHGADTLAQKIKQTKPHWFKGLDVPKFNSGGGIPVSSEKELTIQSILEVERKQGKAAARPLYLKLAEQRAKKA